jgi:3-deoxy-D-manno-octulosonic-acid transferase
MGASTTKQQWRTRLWYEQVALVAYGWLMGLARPLLRRKLAMRAAVEPGYAQDIPARFGHHGTQAEQCSGPVVWIHAVSLGETRAAAVLLKALRVQMPDIRVLLTHGTATGRAEGQHLLQPGDQQTWLPWDDPWSVRRFIAHHRPTVGVLMETEIWPTLLAQTGEANIPMVLVNARLNPRSTRGAQRMAWLSRPAYASLATVGAQTAEDAMRLREVGAHAPEVWGNLKFDAQPDGAQQARGAAGRQLLGRPVVLLASSRDGEELDLYKEIQALPHDLSSNVAINKFIFLMVPRHPQRFDEVAHTLQQAGANVVRRSEWVRWLTVEPGQAATHTASSSGPEIWLGDSMGEMAFYATLADVALLGGSFQPLGGQNLIELAACGCTVVAGPHTFNFSEATEQAIAAGVAHRVPDMKAGVAQACRLLGPTSATGFMPSHHRRQQAEAWARSHQGAVQRAVQAIEVLLRSQKTQPTSAGAGRSQSA